MARKVKNSKAPDSEKKTKKVNIKLIILFALLTMFIAAIAFVMWVVSTVDLSIGDSMSTLNLKLTSVIYCQNSDTGEWEEYEYLSSEGNRIWADIDTIPNHLEDAFVAIEDQRFMSHRGVDWKRTLSATFNEIFGGGSTYGGSSITQQLVKNLTGENDRSYMRKIKEIIRAITLESKLSKQQILELYLNSIYLGQGCNGVESASQVYFNKSVNELTLAEAASIAGITQYPSLYDPFMNRDKNIEKQRTVLYKMLELGYITQEEYDEAIAEELVFVRGETDNSTSQSYFVDQVVEEVIDDLRAEYGYSEAIATQMVYNGGLKIYATVDRDVQSYAEAVFMNDNNFPGSGGDEQPESAMVITEPSTGHVKAIIGGRGEKTLSRGWNRATQTTRQPGSTIKPLSVYGPAIDLGLITPDSIVADDPFTIGNWSPKNHYDGFYGDMTVRRAVNISANIPAIKVLQKLTVDKSFDYMANNLGFTTLVDNETRDGKVYSDKGLPTLALGGLTDGVTVLEMSAAYAAFANDGVYIEPATYTKVEDNIGKTVLTKSQESHTAFKPATAYQMNQLLKGVVTSGTAAGSTISGMDTAGKTGTTDNNVDRWFAGYTPYYSAVVWAGYDSSNPLPSAWRSPNPALNIWKKVMVKIHEDLPNRTFVRPSGMESISVCYITGLRSSGHCYDDEGNSTAVYRYYDKANIPKGYCSGDHGKTPEEITEDDENVDENGTIENGDGDSGGSTPESDSSPGGNNSSAGADSDNNSGGGEETVPEAPPENITE